MVRRFLPVAIVVLLIGDVIGLAALPSGKKKLADVVPKHAVVVLNRSLDKIRVLVINENRSLRLLVAYRQRSRWHSVRVAKAPAGSHAAWAATEGSGPVPAFSAVYGRAPGDKVVVHWRDGTNSPIVPENGVYLALRRGHFRPEGVDLNPAPAP
jgi:hypothetical protein